MSYSNDDLAVIPPSERTWGIKNYASLWIGMSICIPTYMIASSLIEGGMNWWQALLTIFLGNLIVLLPMMLNGHAGARYGISFPIFARASFGIRGANIPAMLRAIVACGWFGIQTWIGGAALYQVINAWYPTVATFQEMVMLEGLGLGGIQAVCFFAFWSLNMFVVHKGIDSIRKLLLFKSIVLPFISLILLAWAISAVDGLGPILDRPARFESQADFWRFFFPGLTGVVGFWATISLNIPDFTRYARSQRDQILGQTLGLPTTMTAFAFVGIAVTSATAILFGEVIWDPIALTARINSPILVTLAMLAVIFSTLATNIAANIVSPANDFANLAPSKISFKAGGYITGIAGVVIMPWKLVSDPSGYIFTWLVAYSSLLGPIGGILITDYIVLRRYHLDVEALYQPKGIYWYKHGFNPSAIVALLVGVLPSIPGFLVATHLASPDTMPHFLIRLYDYAWFVGFTVAGAVYAALYHTMSPRHQAATLSFTPKEEQRA